MRRGVRCLAAAVMVVAATGCNFTESEEIARPDDSVATTASSATTTSGVPSGAKPLVALADGAQPKPGATVDVTTVKQLQAQLVSKQTAADLPAADGRYDLTGRVIVAPQPVIDGLVDDGRLSDAITADVAFVDVLEDEAGTKPEATKPNGAKGGPSSSTAPGSNGTPAGRLASLAAIQPPWFWAKLRPRAKSARSGRVSVTSPVACETRSVMRRAAARRFTATG